MTVRARLVLDTAPNPYFGPVDVLELSGVEDEPVRFELVDPPGVPTLVESIARKYGDSAAAAAARALVAGTRGPGR